MSEPESPSGNLLKLHGEAIGADLRKKGETIVEYLKGRPTGAVAPDVATGTGLTATDTKRALFLLEDQGDVVGDPPRGERAGRTVRYRVRVADDG